MVSFKRQYPLSKIIREKVSVSKFTEKIILKRLEEIIETNRLLPHFQHPFGGGMAMAINWVVLSRTSSTTWIGDVSQLLYYSTAGRRSTDSGTTDWLQNLSGSVFRVISSKLSNHFSLAVHFRSKWARSSSGFDRSQPCSPRLCSPFLTSFLQISLVTLRLNCSLRWWFWTHQFKWSVR